ncbi:uncharacterized protein [Panulirus ornatus]|uniref:uncharacterized protein n=1 Tax=Panulirus ornatus TaxID=150431 RepID=UPI003A84D544
MKAAVVRVVRDLLQETKCAADHNQDVDQDGTGEGEEESAVTPRMYLLLQDLQMIVRLTLYLSPTIHYLSYGTHLARHFSHVSGSGESLQHLEMKLIHVNKRLEDSLTTRNNLTTSLTNYLQHLDLSGGEAVLYCRQESKSEQQEVRRNSNSNLGQLQVDLQDNRQAMASQEARHQEQELSLRQKRIVLLDQMKRAVREYDCTMSRLQTQLDQLKYDHAYFSQLLHHKQVLLESVQAQYLHVLKTRQQQEQERLAAMQEEFRREHAARIIQRAWQHYHITQMIKRAQRKKKRKLKK